MRTNNVRRTINIAIIPLFAIFLMISACSNENNNNENSNNNNNNADMNIESENNDSNNNENENNNNHNNNEDHEEETAFDENSDFSSIIAEMEELTQGEASILYENNDRQEHEMESVTVTLEGYTFIELDDFHTDFSIPFDDETEGGVILADVTIENAGDEDVYYMASFHVEYPGTTKFFSHKDILIPEDLQMKKHLNSETDFLLEAGDTISGYYAFAFSPEKLEEIRDLSTVTIRIDQPYTDKDDVNTTIGQEGKFDISLNEEGEAKKEEQSKFYEDLVTYENMGEKTMLKEKEDIDETKDLRDVKVTLEGYQFTEFEPNEVEAPRFENFTEGIVLLTVKLHANNSTDHDILRDGILSYLYVNDGSEYMSNEAMLGPHSKDRLIEAGESDEIIQVFVLDQEKYEKIWKDKSFELEIGPFENEDLEDISKGNTITFTLPDEA